MGENSCNVCPPLCLENVPEGPVTIPKFHSTYVGHAKQHYPINFLNYDSQCGGYDNCGRCGPICKGQCTLVCNTIPQAQQKYDVLRHNNNYIGTSKKMAYGKFVRNTPGLYTFASKKVPSLQPTVKMKLLCRSNYPSYKKVCTPAEETVKVMTEKEDLVSLLQDIEYSDTVLFVPPTVPFVVPIHIGKVIQVYDGDTITIASVLPNTTEPIYRFRVRLSSIDTPEIAGQTPEEKKLAILARDALYAKIYGKIVTLKNVDTEKYGRVLADVYLNEESITEWLLSNNYGVPYDGGIKNRPESWGVIEN